MAPPPTQQQQPPTQAGKFKPRKPAKKIRAGAATTGDHAAAAATSSAAAVPPAVRSSSSHTTSTASPHPAAAARGGRAGRGGRGRGAGRADKPIVQGPSFFTAQPAPVASSSQRGGGGAARAAAGGGDGAATAARGTGTVRGGRDSNHANTSMEEEIVGTLDEAIFPEQVESSAAKKKAATRGKRRMPRRGWIATALRRRAARRRRRCLRRAASFWKVTIPIRIPVGKKTTTRNPRRKPRHVLRVLSSTALPQPLSPTFATTTTTTHPQQQQQQSTQLFGSATMDQKNELFLVQFPTRLPPVVPQAQLKTEDMDVDDVQFIGSTGNAARRPPRHPATRPPLTMCCHAPRRDASGNCKSSRAAKCGSSWTIIAIARWHDAPRHAGPRPQFSTGRRRAGSTRIRRRRRECAVFLPGNGPEDAGGDTGCDECVWGKVSE